MSDVIVLRVRGKKKKEKIIGLYLSYVRKALGRGYGTPDGVGSGDFAE